MDGFPVHAVIVTVLAIADDIGAVVDPVSAIVDDIGAFTYRRGGGKDPLAEIPFPRKGPGNGAPPLPGGGRQSGQVLRYIEIPPASATVGHRNFS